MRGSKALTGAAMAALLVAGTASADVVRLRDGDFLEGSATDLGESVRVSTPGATVEIPWSRVGCIDRAGSAAEEFRTRRAAVKDGDPKGLFTLALWARRNGLLEESRDLAGKVVALDAAHEGARGLLGEQRTGEGWKGGEALLAAKGFVARDGKWLLREEAEALDRRTAIEKKASEEEKRAAKLLESLGDRNPAVRTYAAEAMASVEPDLRRRLYLVGARHRNAEVRAAAAAGLGVKGDEGVVRTLLQLAVKDAEPAVRAKAAASLKAVALPEVARPLVRALDAEAPGVRMNAAYALGVLEDRGSVETLVRRVQWVAGPSPRVNLQVMNQVSYISDYDVEIAQLAQIGDPIVSQLREGIVLDVKVFGAEGNDIEIERRVYGDALARITGRSFGSDGKAWASWWESEGRATYARK